MYVAGELGDGGMNHVCHDPPYPGVRAAEHSALDLKSLKEQSGALITACLYILVMQEHFSLMDETTLKAYAMANTPPLRR